MSDAGASPDAVFWERVADMPTAEAEQELVARRTAIVAENEVLATDPHRWPGSAAGRQMAANSAAIAVLNERIKYLRKLQTAICWRAAVGAVYGADGVERCAVWIEQQMLTQDTERHGWRPGAPG